MNIRKDKVPRMEEDKATTYDALAEESAAECDKSLKRLEHQLVSLAIEVMKSLSTKIGDYWAAKRHAFNFENLQKNSM